MEKALPQLVDQAVLLIPRLGTSLVVFIAFWGVAVVAAKIVSELGEKSRQAQEVLVLLARTAKIAILAFGLVTSLGTIGINVSALVAGLGLTGFALGFALKDSLSNLLAGVLILTYRPFGKEDQIAVAGFDGRVVEIDLRYTTLEQADHGRVLIPNSSVFTNPIAIKSSGGST
jgi:small conductance mechanosensitive channel